MVDEGPSATPKSSSSSKEANRCSWGRGTVRTSKACISLDTFPKRPRVSIVVLRADVEKGWGEGRPFIDNSPIPRSELIVPAPMYSKGDRSGLAKSIPYPSFISCSKPSISDVSFSIRIVKSKLTDVNGIANRCMSAMRSAIILRVCEINFGWSVSPTGKVKR